jgi:hypothetical protein
MLFEDRVVSGIFGHRSDEVTVNWGKLQNKVLQNVFFSHNIIRVIKSRRMRLARHVARMRVMTNT